MDEEEIVNVLGLICDGECNSALEKLDGYILRSNLTPNEELIIQSLQIIAESVILYTKATSEIQKERLVKFDKRDNSLN